MAANRIAVQVEKSVCVRQQSTCISDDGRRVNRKIATKLKNKVAVTDQGAFYAKGMPFCLILVHIIEGSLCFLKERSIIKLCYERKRGRTIVSQRKLSEEKVFKDPVHRYVHVRDKVIWDLIGTKEFQRLRRIKQLGTTYLTFHGAEHSRFNHSLGVYEIVRRIVDDVFAGRADWDENERLLCLCAALLHDLGHGPFSHSFEKCFILTMNNLRARLF